MVEQRNGKILRKEDRGCTTVAKNLEKIVNTSKIEYENPLDVEAKCFFAHYCRGYDLAILNTNNYGPLPIHQRLENALHSFVREADSKCCDARVALKHKQNLFDEKRRLDRWMSIKQTCVESGQPLFYLSVVKKS